MLEKCVKHQFSLVLISLISVDIIGLGYLKTRQDIALKSWLGCLGDESQREIRCERPLIGASAFWEGVCKCSGTSHDELDLLVVRVRELDFGYIFGLVILQLWFIIL